MAYRIPRYLVVLIGAALLVSGCTTKSVETPPLTGPSELGTAIGIAASPDVLAQDGASQSLITVTAHDSNGQLLRNLPLRAEISVDGAITDFGSLSARNIVTDATGRAFVTYTAPPTPPIFVDSGTIVQINVIPAGTNFDNATNRFVSIRLVPPGVIGAPPSPFRPTIAVSGSTNAGDTTVFSASVTNASGGDATNQIASYAWNFGDGDTGSGRNVSHSFDDAGTFSVSLTITDALGRRATALQAITIAPPIVGSASIVVSPSSPNIGQAAIFSASTSRPPAGHSISNFFWEFGDGTTGGGVSISHAYAAAGNYTVTLTVSFSNGAEAVTTTGVGVGTGTPLASFTFSPSSPLAGGTVSFDASASQPAAGRTIVTYRWNFDDGSPVVNTASPTTTHTYPVNGSYAVSLTVIDNAGQTGQTTRTVTIGSGTPTASFTNSPTSPFAHDMTVFDGQSSTAAAGRTIVGYAWSWGDGTAGSIGATANHSFNTPGTFVVRLTVTDNAGQTGTITQSVTVRPDAPTASFTVQGGGPIPPAGSPVNFDGSSPLNSTAVGGRTLTYSWNFGDPASGPANNTSTLPAPSHTFAAPGTYTVTLTVTDSAGQTATTTRTFGVP